MPSKPLPLTFKWWATRRVMPSTPPPLWVEPLPSPAISVVESHFSSLGSGRARRSWQSFFLAQAPCGRRLLRRSAYRYPPLRAILVISTNIRRATWVDGAGYGAPMIRKARSRGTPIAWTPRLTCLLMGRLSLTSTHCESAPIIAVPREAGQYLRAAANRSFVAFRV